MEKNTIKSHILFLMFGMVITGAANTLLFKLQDKQIVSSQPFSHPFLQTFTMFIGEISCYILYFIQKKISPTQHEQSLAKARQEGLKLKGSTPWLLIPAISDFLTTSLQFLGLMLIDASIYQMLRGGVIIVTAVFSVVFLKRKITRNQIIGIVLAVIGIGAVGVSALERNNGNLNISGNAIFGIGFVLLSLITNGIIFVSEEKIFSIYHLEPLQVVGLEGMWGVGICLMFIPILNFVKIGVNSQMGILYEGQRYVERVDVYIDQIRNSQILMFSCIAALFSIAFFNFFGVSVTKNSSALARSLLDVTRTIFVWGIGLLIPNDKGGYWESFSFLQFIGFIILIIGTLTYNNFIIIVKETVENENKHNEEEENLMKEKENGTTVIGSES